MFSLRFIVCILLFAVAPFGLAQENVVVLGDSASTGAMLRNSSNKALSPPPKAPRFLWPTSLEFDSGVQWLLQITSLAQARLFVNDPSHSWINLISDQAKKNIFIAAENGASTRDSFVQSQRIMQHPQAKLARDFWFFFSLGDVCKSDLDDPTSGEEYQKNIERAAENILAQSSSTTVPNFYFVSPLAYARLLESSALLQKKITLDSHEMTCGEMFKKEVADHRQAAPLEMLSISMMRILGKNDLVGTAPLFCPGLFAGRLDKRALEKSRAVAANRLRSYRENLKTLQKKLAQKHLGSKFYVLDQSFQLELNSSDDFANDCLHLSEAGNKKLAHALEGELASASPKISTP